jgi:hypothetical protein
MRDCGVAEDQPSAREKLADRFIVCAGAYPLSRLPTFAAAAEQASAFVRFMASGEISIYEVETGIHFDVPSRGRFDGVQVETFLPRPE